MIGTISLFAGMGLILINFFLKSNLVWLAVILCMIGVLFEPVMKDAYIQSAAVLIMIFAALKFFFGVTSALGSRG